MTNSTSIQRIIDNLRSDNPSMSIWADLKDYRIEIQQESTGYGCILFEYGTTNKRTHFYDQMEIANYLEQNYV